MSLSKGLTPPYIAKALYDAFRWFDLDPAAPAGLMHIKARDKYTNTHGLNGLKLPWNFPKVFVNPPFGRGQLKKWIAKMLAEWEAENMQQLVALIKFGRTSEGFDNIINYPGAVMLEIGQVPFVGYKAPSSWSNGFVLFGVGEEQVAKFRAALVKRGVPRVTRNTYS